MDMHSWVPSPFTWNYHHIVNHLYSNTKYNVYKKKKSSIYTTVNIYCMLSVFGTLSIIFLKRWKYCFCFKNSLKWKSTSTINNRSKQKMKSNSVIWKSLSIYGKECQGHISMLKRFFYMSMKSLPPCCPGSTHVLHSPPSSSSLKQFPQLAWVATLRTPSVTVDAWELVNRPRMHPNVYLVPGGVGWGLSFWDPSRLPEWPVPVQDLTQCR